MTIACRCLTALLLTAAFASVGIARTWDGPRGPVRSSLDDADPNATVSLVAHDVGNVRMTIGNRGEMGNPDGTPGFKGFEYPKNSGNDFLFSAGVWVGAVRNGMRLVSTTTDGDNGTNEFWPRHIGTLPASNVTIHDWFLTSTFLNDFGGRQYVCGSRGIDEDGDWTLANDLNGDGLPSANYDGGHGTIGYDDDGDGLVDEEIANNLDDDGDGRIDEDTDSSGDANHDGLCGYDPEPHMDEDPVGDISHDWVDNDHDGLVDMDDPDYDGDLAVGSNDDDGDGQWDEDGSAWGLQEYVTVYQDSIQASYVGSPNDPHTPLEIEIVQRSRAWVGGTAQDFILAEYTVRNVGATPLDSVYIAFFADPDICAAGEGGDAGSLDDANYYSAARQMAVQYDDPTDADGWGPGVFACRVLKTPVPLSNLRFSFAIFDRLTGGDPEFDAAKYQMISSGFISPPSPNLGDVRFLMAFGDAAHGGFHIPPGGELEFALAYIGAADTVAVNTTADRALQTYYAEYIRQQAAPPMNLRLLSTSPGMVQLGWSPPLAGGVQGYHVFGRDSAGLGQQEHFNTSLVTDTTFTINALQTGSDWLMQVQTVDDSGWVSPYAELLVRVAAPQPVTGLSGETHDGIVTLQWNPNPESNITGYRVLRVTEVTDSSLFTVTTNSFTDSTARGGWVNTYRVAAMNDWGVQSLWDLTVELAPFGPQRRILLLDQTQWYQVGCMPTDSVRELYEWMMDEIGEDYLYYASTTLTSLDTLAQYDLVIWVAENPRSNLSTPREEAFLQYRRAGGKMIRITRSLMYNNLGYPQGDYYGPFTWFEPLTFDSAYVSRVSLSPPWMKFAGAAPAITGFPSFMLDTARVGSLYWSGRHIPFLMDVDLFWPRLPTQPLYRTVMLPTDSSGFENEPCAVIGPQMIVLAFPLYFMDRDTARMLLEACIDTLRAQVIESTEPKPGRIVPQTSRLHPNYPNPFNPWTTIHFDLQRSGRTRLAIYNLLGQEVAVLRDGMMASGSHVVCWEGTDRRGLAVGTGIYFARLDAPDGVSVIKLALIR
ncbi:MAG: fibronectin type III domain-containing protein [bacterium]|nr:fibronectin type III domain-containing protein [bacterium]